MTLYERSLSYVESLRDEGRAGSARAEGGEGSHMDGGRVVDGAVRVRAALCTHTVHTAKRALSRLTTSAARVRREPTARVMDIGMEAGGAGRRTFEGPVREPVLL